MKLFILSIFSLSTFAGKVTRFNHHTSEYTYSDMSITNFSVKTNDYRVDFKDGVSSFGTTMYADFKTKEIEDLFDYVVVQYIKGCRYNSYISSEGELVKYRGISREFFDDIVTFQHKDWVIDSVDADPVYNSAPDIRQNYYRWNAKEGYNRSSEFFVVNKYPENTRLYVRDMPGTASMSHGFATNTSLSFKTCVFKSVDVPYTVTNPSVDLMDKALTCVEWNSSFVYDFKEGKYQSSEKLDEFCLR